MRQIFNANEKLLSVGDYAFLNFINLRGDSFRVLAFRYSVEDWAFYSNDIDLNGATEPRSNTYTSLWPFLGDYISSWRIGAYKSIIEGWMNYTASDSNIDSLEIIQEAIELPNCSNIIESDVVTEPSTEFPARYLSMNYQRDEYVGMQIWHYHHGQHLNEPICAYRKHRIGVELEVEFNNQDLRDEFINIPSNWFYRETDGSLRENVGCEIITIPLLPKDAKDVDFWSSLTNDLTGKAVSWDTTTCGLHIHIGREILGKDEEQRSETLGKLLFLYHHHLKDTRFNIKMFGRERGYHDRCAKSVAGDAVLTLGKDVLKSKSACKVVKDAMINSSDGNTYPGDGNRYFDINLQNTHTIEFRKGRGSINPKRIAAVVEYCELMCIYAKNTPWPQISYEDFIAYLKGTGGDFIKDIITATVF
jgi:hypothetical protein